MKMEDLFKPAPSAGVLETPADGKPSQRSQRKRLHPELTELMNACRDDMLSNCQSLARDEIGLAQFIVNTLTSDPAYKPSATLLQAIRAINRKLDADSPLRGMVRTA